MDGKFLSAYSDAKHFQNVLSKIPDVNVSEESLLFGENENFNLPSPYNGRDKKIIHHYCQIGGAWESYWRSICKNDSHDKKIFKIFRQIENENLGDDFSANFFCNEKRCEKIGVYKFFFKDRCLKTDEKFFYIFLRQHKNEIIDELIR